MRIIAGRAKGRRFDAPDGVDTRPTLDRVKEAMFGSVQFEIPGSRVLDLFSGSGNLGLEAASRGAARVVLNDRSPVCAKLIRRNAECLGLADCTVVMREDYARAIDMFLRSGERFDVVFIDAPYADGTAQDAAERLFTGGVVEQGGCVLVEHAVKLPPQSIPGLMRIVWTRRYGTCCVSRLEEDTKL